jgi:tetratricopeptide (TPR) repeat protein/TolB-like protein
VRRILICIVVALLCADQARADSGTVLVFPFENRSNDRTLDWIGEGISELIIERLQPEPGVYALSREERLGSFEKLGIPETTMVSRATALKLGWDVGADHVVTGGFTGTIEKFQIAARLIDMETGAAEQITAEGKLANVIPMGMSVAWWVLKKIDPGTASPETDYIARPPTPRSAFENYIRGILNQDLSKRIELLQTAVRLHPQYASAIFQLGRSYHLQRDFKNSNEWLRKIPETSFLRGEAQFFAGLNYFYLTDYPAAITTFQSLPPAYHVLLNLGSVFSQKGDSAAAIATWKRAAELDPLTSDAFFNMGYASFLKNDLDGATKHLNESLKLRSRDSEALFLLGRTYEKQGRPDEGQKAIAQASHLSQRVERWLNQPLPKLERVAAAPLFRSHNEIWTNKRLARRARGQDLSTWLESIQTDIDSYLLGDALRELEDVIRIYPESPEPRSVLEEVHRQQSR